MNYFIYILHINDQYVAKATVTVGINTCCCISVSRAYGVDDDRRGSRILKWRGGGGWCIFVIM